MKNIEFSRTFGGLNVTANPNQNNNNNHDNNTSSARSRHRIPKYSSAFASKVDRLAVGIESKQLTPGPQTYDLDLKWNNNNINPSKMMKNTFTGIKNINEKRPGPMDYNIPSTIKSTIGNNRKNIMFNTETREKFYEKPIPGVGSYNIQTSMIRPTFNVYLADSY